MGIERLLRCGISLIAGLLLVLLSGFLPFDVPLSYRPGETVIDGHTSGTFYFSPRSSSRKTVQYEEFRRRLPEELKRKFTTSFWMDDEVTVKFRDGRIVRMTGVRKIRRYHLEGHFYPNSEDWKPGLLGTIVQSLYSDSRHSRFSQQLLSLFIASGRVLGPTVTWKTVLDYSGLMIQCRSFLDGKLYAEGTFTAGKKPPLRIASTVLRDFDGRSDWPLHGIFRTYYDTGKIAEIVRFDRGNQLYSKSYLRDGRLGSEWDFRGPEFYSYRSYLYFGRRKELHEHTVTRKSTGRLIREHTFAFDREGNLQNESLQVENQPGYIKVYDGKGHLRRENVRLGFELHGICRDYYPNGAVAAEIPYVHGRREGVTRRFLPDGTLRAEIPWRNNRKEGVVKTYWIDEDYGRNKGVICTPYEFNLEHGTITDTNFTRNTTSPRSNYYFGKLHGLQHENPPRRYYYGVDTGDRYREMPPFATTPRDTFSSLTSWLGTPYQRVYILRILRACTAKNAPALLEPDGVLYVECENPPGFRPEEASKLKLKLKLAVPAWRWKNRDCGFLAENNPENWQKQTLLKEYPFPSRKKISPSRYFILLRVGEWLYRICLDRQWSLSNWSKTDPWPQELNVILSAEMIRGPELKQKNIQ